MFTLASALHTVVLLTRVVVTNGGLLEQTVDLKQFKVVGTSLEFLHQFGGFVELLH